MENSLERARERERERERESSMKFCMKLPPGSSSQEFLAVFYVGSFAWKFIDSIYRGPRIEMYVKKKKTQVNILPQCP